MKVTRLVAENFVPVALNTDRLPDSPEGTFFRSLMKQWPQGFWVVATDGKALAHHYYRPRPNESAKAGRERWLTETIALLETGLKEAGPLSKRKPAKVDVLGDRGIGFAMNGSVRVAVSVAGFQRNRREGSPAVDSFRLTRMEWAALAPPDRMDHWEVPKEVAARFAPALCPLTDVIFVPTSDDVEKAELQAKVVRKTGELAIIEYAGCWEAKHHRDGDPRFPIRSSATGTGVGVFDHKSNTFREVVFVLRGDYDNGTRWGTAAVVEWRVAK